VTPDAPELADGFADIDIKVIWIYKKPEDFSTGFD
jgi:hypothetical protein